ncbi:hypothetical protein [Nocardia iowensis]|uniref:hypothetical protein n=1 Tax=Nocardia iowensis TaxID=204891 RepID=UPI001FE85F3D|nr:hypothetical protein [Nocardia iowensis]
MSSARQLLPLATLPLVALRPLVPVVALQLPLQLVLTLVPLVVVRLLALPLARMVLVLRSFDRQRMPRPSIDGPPASRPRFQMCASPATIRSSASTTLMCRNSSPKCWPPTIG